jgi:hypothetical protein
MVPNHMVYQEVLGLWVLHKVMSWAGLRQCMEILMTLLPCNMSHHHFMVGCLYIKVQDMNPTTMLVPMSICLGCMNKLPLHPHRHRLGTWSKSKHYRGEY